MTDEDIEKLLDQVTSDTISNTKKREIVKILLDMVKSNTEAAKLLTLEMERIDERTAR